MSIMEQIMGGVMSPIISPIIGGGSAPFNPTDVNATPWWSSTDTATITQSLGTASQWNDKTGAVFNATQPSASAQPSIIVNARNSLNSLGGQIGNPFMTTNYFPSGAKGVVCVVKLPDTAREGSPFGCNDGQSRRCYFRYNLNRTVSVGFGSVFATTTATFSPDAWLVMLLDVNTATGRFNFYINGVRVLTDQSFTFSSASSTAALLFSRESGSFPTEFFNTGYLSELAFVKPNMTIAEMNQLGNFFGSKWNIAWSDIV